MTPSNSSALFQASVPVFVRYLGRLQHLLARAQEHAALTDMPEQVLLDAALAPDMLPFATQVEVACNFTLRATFPLAGLPIPPYGAFERSFAGLQQRLLRAELLLDELDPAAFDAAPARTIQAEAGQATHTMTASEYLLHYASPNFFFHTTAAFAILRQQGVPVGKADFDGYHAYGR
ncbi:DUF1993 domain-containing protein [Rhodoferax sp. AJA081-3]|uniref:DUF1993 domain-containing protein n=1 Tax=Rhodoferax sp. AJA081-3 TaxID=2752316 RepID=UPI001AE05099|nr:DUF1993 domain-containing protein [Rhodoferax sp. AJA081-3]QTN27264.1 DUF1993 domain-containing protein [Rhodoferax sp. AJA081-3]